MRYDLVVIGGGPAGMTTALTAKEFDIDVLIIDDNPILGGQLIKQTHKFFGSKDYYCGFRGFQISELLRKEIKNKDVPVMCNTTATGVYPGFEIGTYDGAQYSEVECQSIVVATGAREKFLTFENNDLPGVYGAGAVQTLMNVYGVFPGYRALMVGSGNIGLIVSYQLLQAGVEVPYLVEILPYIGGWFVHGAKVARAGTKILTSHTILSAVGEDSVCGAVIAKVDERFRPIKGEEKRIDVDLICLACGLSPLADLLWQVGCKMSYIPELGGYLAWHNERMETSKPGIFVAGDVAGIEEATTAMLEGKIAGISAAAYLKGKDARFNKIREKANVELSKIRAGDFSGVVIDGLKRL